MLSIAECIFYWLVIICSEGMIPIILWNFGEPFVRVSGGVHTILMFLEEPEFEVREALGIDDGSLINWAFCVVRLWPALTVACCCNRSRGRLPSGKPDLFPNMMGGSCHSVYLFALYCCQPFISGVL